MSQLLLEHVGEQDLVESIRSAKKRIVFAGPGVSEALSRTIAEAWKRLGAAVTVVLDVDPEVYRLGYGSLNGLAALEAAARAAGANILQRKGQRVGLLLSDDDLVVFTPTPEAVESGKTTAQAPNAVRMSLPTAESAAVSLTAARGSEVTRPEVLASVREDLAKNPPIQFDISRKIRVFNARVEFVEFGIDKIQLQRQEIAIPPELLGFTPQTMRALFRLEPGADLLAKKEALERRQEELTQEFTRPVKGFGGSLIRRADKERFVSETEKLGGQLEEFRRACYQRFGQIVRDNKDKLRRTLVPIVQKTPPRDWPGPMTPQEVEKRVGQALDQAFERITMLTRGMRVRVLFKGVTYECLNDPAFIRAAQKAFPDLGLHTEHDALPEAGAEG